MASGNNILVTGEPKGNFLEGIISGTPSPGTAMEIVPATEPIGGRFTWRVYQPGTDGEQRIVAILLEDYLQGKLATSAYASGDRCQLYCPIPGDVMNILLADVAGTADTHAIGDLVIPDTGTGLWIATTGSPEMEPFVLLETLAAPTAATLCMAMYTGH